MTEAEGAVVPVLIKSDVHGSTEALRDALTKLSTDEVKVKVISSGVGGITESDATLAAASNATIIGFNVRPDSAARNAIKESGVEIRRSEEHTSELQSLMRTSYAVFCLKKKKHKKSYNK